MATSFGDTPTWFDVEFYLGSKLSKLIEEDPKGNWTRESMLEAFTAADCVNPYDHYLVYGDGEGLSPNPLFDSTEYLLAKTAQMGSTWTVEMVAKAIEDAGLTLMEHYLQFGSAEGLNPSSDFDQDKYFDAKLDQLQTTEPDKAWTLESMKAAFATAGITPLEHYLTYAKAEKLDQFDYSENGAPIPHPGNNIVLTTGADVVTKDATVEALKTSDRDDVISGVVSSVAAKGTFTAGDVIDGGMGVDTLKLDMQGNFNFKSGGVKNVEQIVLDNAAGFTFDAKGVEAADVYTVNGGDKGNVTIKNVDSTATSYSLKQAAGKFDVQIVDSALTGKTDNVEIALNGVGTDAGAVALTVKGASTGKVEGLTLLAEGKDNFVTLAQGHATAAVMGAGNLNVGVAADMATFDASGATGKITADLRSSLATLKTINGGSADDTFTVGALLGSAIVDGGNGNDTLKFGTLAPSSVIKSTITGVETFDVTAAATQGAVTFDLSKVDGLETIKLAGTNITSDGDFSVLKASAYDAMNLQVANELVSVKSFTYDGNGVLNVSHNGGSAGTDTAVTTLSANSITDLTVTNNADSGTLTIGTLNATALTALTINAGSEDGVTFTGTTTKLNNLESLTINGDAAVDFTYGASASKLITVNATGLTEDLALDLSGASLSGAEGVTVTMGTGGATLLKGTAKADTFNLGAGAEKVVLAAGGGADMVVGLSTGDTLDIVASDAGTALTALTAALGAFAANKVYTKTITSNLDAVDEAMVDAFFNATTVTTASNLVITDASGNVGVYEIVGSANDGLTLTAVGVLTDLEVSITAATFA